MKMFFHTHTERNGIGLRANCGPDCQCHAGENDGLAAARELLAAARAKGGEPSRADVLAALAAAIGENSASDPALAAMMAGESAVQRDNAERNLRSLGYLAHRPHGFTANFATEDKTAAEMVPISFAAALAAKAKGEKKEAA